MSQDWYLCAAKEDKTSVSFHSGLLAVDMLIASRCASDLSPVSVPANRLRLHITTTPPLEACGHWFPEHGSDRLKDCVLQPPCLGSEASRGYGPAA
jgi:hypothetical protein